MSKKRRIAIVVNSIIPGAGVNNAALKQAQALNQFFSVTLVCAHADASDFGFRLRKIREPSLLWLRRFGHVIREYLLCRRFAAELNVLDRYESFDFILFHSHTSAAIVRSKLLRSIPCAMVIHGDIFTRPQGSYDPYLTWLYKHCSRRAYRDLELVVALSPMMEMKAVEYGAASDRVKVVPNGIDVTELKAKSFGQSNKNALALLFVGRLAPEKGPLVLLEALSLVRSSVELYLAGVGPLEAQIRDFVTRNALQGKVHFLGQLDSTELVKKYRECDALCVPSVNDPLPTVVLEAMREGLPVIGSDIDGIPYMVEDSQTGLVVRPGDPHALALAIDTMAESIQLRQKMSIASQYRLIQRFGLEAVSRRLAMHIEETIKAY